MVGLAAFFQAMVVGTINIVAPISATGVVVPIVAGIVGGERAGAEQVVGMVAAIAGIVLAARTPRVRPSAPAESGLGLALLAALGGGLFFWLMAPARRLLAYHVLGERVHGAQRVGIAPVLAGVVLMSAG